MIQILVTHSFLEDLALVLCIAAAVTVIFHVMRQPVVVGYLVAGMIVGPHTPGVFVDPSRIEAVSELGVILLMFALGLEFSLRRLLRLGPRAAFITARWPASRESTTHGLRAWAPDAFALAPRRYFFSSPDGSAWPPW